MGTLVLHLLRARLRGWRLVGAAALVLFQPAVAMLSILTGPSNVPTASRFQVPVVRITRPVKVQMQMVSIKGPRPPTIPSRAEAPVRAAA